MAKKRSTKRALILSALAIVMCISMLIGSTYAWFTDTVTSGNNKIVSGNLDVVLEYKTADMADWVEVDADTKIFDENALYEPGYTEVVFLRVSNAGSLALKYRMAVNIVSETPAINVYDEEFKLSDYLMIGSYFTNEYSGVDNWSALIPYLFANREDARKQVAANAAKLSEFGGIFSDDQVVLPGDNTAMIGAVVLYMPETVGNEANYKTGTAAPEINLGINLLATQYTHEEDSFGPDYDEDATYPVAATAEELKEALAKGGMVTLTDNITLTEQLSITKDITINLNGKTVTSTAKKAFEVHANATLENGTIKAANRCVDTRTNVELTMNNVTLIADDYNSAYGNPQPLTIGGSDNGTKVTLNNCTISAKAGYAIITFVETELTATDSTIGGYSALYVKPGSDNSTFNFVNTDISASTGNNDVAGNSFSAIAVRANNVTVNVDADSSLTATGEYCYAISLSSTYAGEESTTGVKVTVDCEIVGNAISEPVGEGNTVTIKG